MKKIIVGLCFVFAAGCGDHYVTNNATTQPIVKKAIELCALNNGWEAIWNIDKDAIGPLFNVLCNNGAKFLNIRI